MSEHGLAIQNYTGEMMQRNIHLRVCLTFNSFHNFQWHFSD